MTEVNSPLTHITARVPLSGLSSCYTGRCLRTDWLMELWVPVTGFMHRAVRADLCGWREGREVFIFKGWASGIEDSCSSPVSVQCFLCCLILSPLRPSKGGGCYPHLTDEKTGSGKGRHLPSCLTQSLPSVESASVTFTRFMCVMWPRLPHLSASSSWPLAALQLLTNLTRAD